MVLLLPSRTDGLRELGASLTVAQMETLIKRLAPIEVDVRMPQFAFRSDLPLNAILSAMGMRDAFIWGTADFSRMSPARRIYPDSGLHLSAVRHSAGIEVDEEGTTAWAGTTVQMNEGPPHVPPVFLADHPFLFFVIEQSSGAILFMGRVVEP